MAAALDSLVRPCSVRRPAGSLPSPHELTCGFCWMACLCSVRQEGSVLSLYRPQGAPHVQTVRERGRGSQPVSPQSVLRDRSRPSLARPHRQTSAPKLADLLAYLISCLLARYDADVRSRLDRIEHLLSNIADSPAFSAKLASGASQPRPTLTVSTSPGTLVATRALGRGSHTDGSEDGGRAGDGSVIDDEEGDEHDGTMRNGRFYGPSASSAMSSGSRMSKLLQNVSRLERSFSLGGSSLSRG